MKAFQLNRAGLFVCEVEADESPLEPGVFLMPAGCTTTPPPGAWGDDKWPRWNGTAWELVTKPAAPAAADPVEKLKQFLDANPDVAAILNSDTAGA